MNDTGKAIVPQSQDDDDAGKEIWQHYAAGSAHVKPDQTTPDSVTVPISETDYVLGSTGAAGDFLHAITISMSIASSNQIILKDGGTIIWQTTGTQVVGPHRYEFNRHSRNGAYTITTAANSTFLEAMGDFT